MPDLSVCDRLIATDFLSEDDWEILHKTKRGKSKIKRLIKLLSKRDDPKSAFTALAKCIALHHEHLSGTVRAALDKFPAADVNCNVYRPGVEHNEGVSQLVDEPRTRDHRKEPVQHDETTVYHYSFCNADDPISKQSPSESVDNEINDRVKEDNNNVARTSSASEPNEDLLIVDNGNCVQTDLNENNTFELARLFGTVEHNEYLFSVYDEKCVQTDLNENRDNDFRKRNKTENNKNGDVLPDYGNIENIYKGLGIQCTNQDTVTTTISYDDEFKTLKTFHSDSDRNRGTQIVLIGLTKDSLHNEQAEGLDFFDGAMGFTNVYEPPNNSDSNPVDIDTDKVDVSNGKDEFYQVDLVERNYNSHDETPGMIKRNGHSPRTQRPESKRLKYLHYHPQNKPASKEFKQPKSNSSNTTMNDTYSNSSQTYNALTTHQTDENAKDEGSLSATHISIDKCSKIHNNINELIETDVPKVHEQYAMCNESQHFVTHRHKLYIDNTPDRPYTCANESTDNNAFVWQTQSEHKNTYENQRQNGDIVSLTPNHPRALSQIDYIPSSVVDKCINRAKSWAGTRTKSHIYDDISSCSEDYTTTDLNYSDLNEVERELCDNLEHSGSITDVVDRLIQEDYLSSDDWCAINEIKVKRNQATYVAKRISNKIRQEGSQSFSNMLKNQPKLRKWLESKFHEAVENAHFTDTPLVEECKHEHTNEFNSNDKDNSKAQSVDQIDGTGIVPYCRYHEMNDSSAVAICNDGKRSIKPISRPETLCPPGIAVDKHFQKVFDTLNTAFNKGALPVTFLPSDPNVKCIVLYLKACDALYKTQTEDAERYIELAEAAVNDTDSPMFMTGEIFTQKTWLCLRTNRLGMMERLLEEHEQFLLANPNIWSNKATGWFYFDFGRFYVRMMSVTKPSRHQMHKRSRAYSKTAYDVYKDKATRCLRKSIDHFSHSDSSDGPIGMGFAISLLASVELDCVTEFGYLNKGVIENNVSESVKLLQTVANLYDEIPDILKTSYLLSKSDLCFRKNEISRAKELVKECVDLSDRLCLQDELRECKKRLRLLNHFT